MQGGAQAFDRNRRDALPRGSGQEGFNTKHWSLTMHRTDSSSLLASVVGSLLTSALLVGVATSLIV
jgi:hypothetical protein